MNVVFMGPPGGGKGIHSMRLGTQGFLRIATGELIRSEIDSRTPRGLAFEPYFKRGDLVPDEDVIALVEETLAPVTEKQDVVFDGFPRTLFQAKQLDQLLHTREEKINLVIELMASPDTLLLERVLGRASLKGESRSDDTTEAFHTRLAIYQKESPALFDWYRSLAIPTHHVDTGISTSLAEANIDEFLRSAQ